jgi:PAS domain S-box-containing protein
MFEGILERINDGILSLDKDGRVLYVNQVGVALLGRETPDDLIGRIFWDEFPEASQNPFKKAFKQVTKLKKQQNLDQYFELLDRYLQIRIFPSPEAATLYFTDISIEKRADTKDSDELSFIQKIIKSSPLFIFLLEVKEDYPTYFSFGLNRILGYSEKEIKAMGRKFAETVCHPDDYEYYKNSIQSKYSTLADNEALEFGVRIKDKEGKWRMFHSREVVFSRNPDGSPAKILGIGMDVTKRMALLKEKRHLEDIFKLALENVADVIAIFGRDRKVKMVNEAVYKLTGVKAEDFVGKLLEDVLSPEVVKNSKQALDDVYLTNKMRSIDTEINPPNGSEISLKVTFIPILDEKEEVEEVIGVVQDLTERAKSKKLLKESEERYRLLVETSPYAIGVIQDEKIVYANSGASHILGAKSPNELIGKPISSLVYQENVKDTLERTRRLLAGEKIAYPIEDRYVRMDGTDFPVEVTASQLEFHGKPAVQVIALDITEKKKAQEELENEAIRRRILIENSRDGIVVLDENGDVFEANLKAAEMLGYTPEEYANLSVFDWDAHFSEENLQTMITTVDRSGDFFETKHRRKDGSEMDVEISSSASMFKGKKLIFCVIRDITKRKKAQKELEQTLTQLRHAVAATISTLMQAIEIRDPYTAGHQRRVADLARSIAEEFNLPSDQIEGIRIAASIHDIGKISIPSEILSKPSKLSDAEMALVREHVNYGYNILKDIESVWPLAEIVHQHHERLDGSGYPQGLKGDQIMIEARILAVADVVEAMASHRPYRPARGIDAALQEIEDKKGTLFDKRVVDTCTRLFRKKGFVFK